MFKTVATFAELVATPFTDDANALCWPRRFDADFAEVIRQLGPGEDIVALEEDRLRALALSPRGRKAVDLMLADLVRLREAGRDPVLNIIHAYPRDEHGGPVPTDVFSWHVDRAPIESDTWLCTYEGAPSEGLPAGGAIRKVDDPAIRAQLVALHGGPDDAEFESWLEENHYDLHCRPREGAAPYSFGRHNLWRIAIQHPGNRPGAKRKSGSRAEISAAPACVHRAPVTTAARLLMIS